MKAAGIAEVETRKPCPRTVPSPPDRRTGSGGLGLAVRVTQDGVEIATAAERLGAGCEAGAPGVTVPRQGGRIQMGLVTACATQIWSGRWSR